MSRSARTLVLGLMLGAGFSVLHAQIPTGPASAITKAAAAVRASRAAAEAAKNAGSTAVAGGSRTTAVMGYLWTANNSPISNATVPLRNTVTGQVEAVTKTNELGQFGFSQFKGGSYVIEYTRGVGETTAEAAVGNTGSVLAVGSPFTVAPGETVATFVRTLNNVTLFVPDLATNIATQAVQTAANAGVTAIVTPAIQGAVEPASSVR